jgi:hypothetical protein
MFARVLSLFAAMVAQTLTTAALAAQQPTTEATMMDERPRLSAKVAKTKAKMSASSDGQSRWGEDGGDSADENRCGNVDIGNVNTAGANRARLKENIVIVTGDVINANNRCR